MSPKNTAAVEKRMDLASLFCMIGRHGPAVVLAVFAVVAGFIIYRRVRRGKAVANDGKETEATPEESHSSVESADVRDDASSGVREDDESIRRDLKIRRRMTAAAAAEKKPPPYSTLISDIQAPEDEHKSSDDGGEMKIEQDSHKVTETYAEEADEGLTSDASIMAEVEVEEEEAADCHRGVTNDTLKDAMEEVHYSEKCLKESELIDDENLEEEDKVFEADCHGDEDVTPDQDGSEKTPRQEEEEEKNLQCSFNIHSESKLDEPVTHIEDGPSTSICYGKYEEEDPDCPDLFSPVDENKNSEMEEIDCEDLQLTAEEAEILFSTSEQEPNLLPSKQDHFGHVTDTATAPLQDSVWDEDDSPGFELIEEVVDGITTGTAGRDSPQFEQKEEETEPKEEKSLVCNQEVADQVKEEIMTDEDIVTAHECDCSSVMSVPVEVDVHDNDLTDRISGVFEFPDLSLSYQPQEEDEMAPYLDGDSNSTFVDPGTTTNETGSPSENDSDGSSMVLTGECNEPEDRSHKDQHSFQIRNDEDFTEANVLTDAEMVNSYVLVEEIHGPHHPSFFEDHESAYLENDETNVHSNRGEVSCSNVHCTAVSLSEELFLPPRLSSSKNQQSNNRENDVEVPEVTPVAAPVVAEAISPPMCQIYLSTFDQVEQRDIDMTSPGVDEESGISSMAVSPDSQDAGKEFDMSIPNMAVPVMDCGLQSGGQTEAQNSLYADDVPPSVSNGDTAGVVSGPHASQLPQAPHSNYTVWSTYESIASKRYEFGHEIENSYHREMDHFAAHISASFTSFTDDLKILTDMNAVVEVVEIKENAGVSLKQEEDTEEQEQSYEKTDISIMEATMDYNEWITESNYQVLPCLNLSATSVIQDHYKNNQPPTQVCPPSSDPTETTSIDSTDTSLSPIDVPQTSAPFPVEENTENRKKVLAVQPMPQNINITFRVHYFTKSPYQTLAVTGNQQELGNWKGFIPLEKAKDGHWATVISLPAESHVEWKFVVLENGDVCRWEECGNRLLDTGFGDDLLVHEWWGLL